MPDIEKLAENLEKLGLGKTEAAAYVQLLVLGPEALATGYQVAKSLGKDPTTVYKALEELARRGAVETVAGEMKDGRGKKYRPIDPQTLTAQLSRDFSRQARVAARALDELPRPVADEEVFRLHTRRQAVDRFGVLLDKCERVALLDLAPETFSLFRGRIKDALDRGVTVVAKLYEEPTERELEGLESLAWTVEPDGYEMLQLMPGPVLHGAFDCRKQLVTYLPRGRARDFANGEDTPVTQAFWTANRFLAFQAHSGLASEIMHTELRGMLERRESHDRMEARQNELSAMINGTVDWEEFWHATGLVPGEVRQAPAELISREDNQIYLHMNDEDIMYTFGQRREPDTMAQQILKRKKAVQAAAQTDMENDDAETADDGQED